MKFNPYKKRMLGSFEDASILRKFTILFIVMSLVPLCLLYFFWRQVKLYGSIQLPEVNYRIIMFFVLIGVSVGYIAMRRLIIQVIELLF